MAGKHRLWTESERWDDAQVVHYRDQATGWMRCPEEYPTEVHRTHTGPVTEIRCPHYLWALRYQGF